MTPATEPDRAEPLECWCCGSVIRSLNWFGSEAIPRSACVCGARIPCTSKARERKDALRPSPASRLRDGLRSARRVVMQRRRHQRPFIGRPLRWLGRRLP
jgi:hypothetical protein